MGRSALHADRSSAIAHASAAVSPVSRTIWLIHDVVCQLGDSNRGAVCLRTWNPRRASEPYVVVWTPDGKYGNEWPSVVR